MSDVTFGVKVSEEMKNELSELMKMNDLSGKEFMGMLLSVYKIEQAKREEALFQSDISELQLLLQRIQNLYLNMTDKSKIILSENTRAFEEVEKQFTEEQHSLKEQLQELEKNLEKSQLACQTYEASLANLKKDNEQLKKESEENKNQAKNYIFLHTKFEQEIKQLEDKIAQLRRYEIEIEERNSENTVLKNRNDELASEIWFLKREAEKLKMEKEQLIHTHELELKNNLLEQKLQFNEELRLLKEENITLQKAFQAKLQSLLENAQNKVSSEV